MRGSVKKKERHGKGTEKKVKEELSPALAYDFDSPGVYMARVCFTLKTFRGRPSYDCPML